jgi:hypothetical protein
VSKHAASQQGNAERNRLSLPFSSKVFGMTIAAPAARVNRDSYCPGGNDAIPEEKSAKALPSMKW